MIEALRRSIVLGIIWVALAGLDLEGVVVGAVVIAAAVAIGIALAPEAPRPVRLGRAFRLLPVFVWQSVLGGIDVARRAFDPRLPLAPGWLVLPAKLPDGAPRVVLGGELSLLPGTLVAGTKNGQFIVHVLDKRQPIRPALEKAEPDLLGAIGAPRR